MTDKMQVLFVKETGHVLAAFTRTADPASKPELAELVGAGLAVRNLTVVAAAPTGGESLLVTPESLDIAVVDLNLDTLYSPRSFSAGGGVTTSLSVDPPPPTLTTNTITVKRSGVATLEGTKFRVQLEEVPPLGGDAPIRLAMENTIDEGDADKTIDLKVTPDGPAVSIPKKAFNILVLVAGHRPLFSRLTPP